MAITMHNIDYSHTWQEQVKYAVQTWMIIIRQNIYAMQLLAGDPEECWNFYGQTACDSHTDMAAQFLTEIRKIIKDAPVTGHAPSPQCAGGPLADHRSLPHHIIATEYGRGPAKAMSSGDSQLEISLLAALQKAEKYLMFLQQDHDPMDVPEMIEKLQQLMEPLELMEYLITDLYNPPSDAILKRIRRAFKPTEETGRDVRKSGVIWIAPWRQMNL